MAEKYLIQRRKGQRDHIYEWTEVLAAKPDMFPISNEDAQVILDQQKKMGHVIHEAPKEKNTIVVKAAEKQRVNMDDIVGNNQAVEPEEEVVTDVTDYDPMKDPIITKVYSLKTKNAVEGFALEQGFQLKRTKLTKLTDMQREFAGLHIAKMTELLQKD